MPSVLSWKWYGFALWYLATTVPFLIALCARKGGINTTSLGWIALISSIQLIIGLSRFWAAPDRVLWRRGVEMWPCPKSLAAVVVEPVAIFSTTWVLLQILSPGSHFQSPSIAPFCFILVSFLMSGHQLSFPDLQRRRFFRVKNEIPGLLSRSALLTIPPLLLSHALHHTSTASLLSLPLAMEAIAWFLAALLSAVAVSLADIVLTERVHVGLFGCDFGKIGRVLKERDAFAQTHALIHVRSEWERSPRFRQVLFNDDVGGDWHVISEQCTGILKDFAQKIREAEPHPTTVQPAAANGRAHLPKPPSLPGRMVQGLWHLLWRCAFTLLPSVVTPPDLHRTQALFRDTTRCCLAAEVLTAISHSSLTEDRYGVVKLALGDVFGAVIAGLTAIEVHVTSPLYVSDSTMRHLGGHRCLRDGPLVTATVLERCLYDLLGSFGPYIHHLNIKKTDLDSLRRIAGPNAF